MTRIIHKRAFHHNNLTLQLLHHEAEAVYTISILRENTGQEHDLWGLFLSEDDALAKFNTISL